MAEPIVLGIVSIKNMGEYNSQTQYERLNVVTYQGSTYCASQSTKGNLPTDTEYWQLYAEKGGKGDTGPQGPKPVKGVDYYTAADVAEIETDLADDISNIVSESVGSLTSATPLVAETASDMIDTTKIYVLVTDGHWYWYDGDSWEDGGVYQATAIGDGEIKEYNINSSILSRYEQEETITFGNVNDGMINDDGTINSDATWVHYTKINCVKGQKLTIRHQIATDRYYVAFYKSDDTFISGIKPESSSVSNDDVLVPNDTSYALIQGYNIVATNLPSLIRLFTIKIKVGKNDILFKNSIDFVDSLMLFADDTKIKLNETDGYYIAYETGVANTLSGLQVSDYIPLSVSNTPINIKCLNDVFKVGTPDARGLAFYDSDKSYISGIQYTNTNTISTNIPENAKYIRLTLETSKEYSIEYTDLNSLINSSVNESNLPLSKIYDSGHLTNIFNQIMCIGDSLTRGALEGYTVPPELWSNELLYSYPKQMERTLGNTVYNLGLSGATTKTWYNSRANYIENDNYKSQCYIIALGTNDIGYNDSFDGNVNTDINLSDYTQNADTSVGWYAKIIQRIRDKYPDSIVFCCGIPNTRNSLQTRTEANEKISAICDLLNCKFLDFQTYGVQPDNVSAWKAKYYKGGHLNVCGYKEFANMVMSYINWYIESDPQSYWKVPFCNLDLE